MPSECYPSRAFCVVHNHGGIHRVNQVNSTNRSGPIGGLTTIHEAKKRGKQLQAAGELQVRLSATSTPVGKIWMPYTKRQHHLQRQGRAGGTLYGAKVSSRKFDYRPSGPSHAAQDRHFRRQPSITGYQPGTGPKATKSHRRTMRIKGAGKILVGRALPVLAVGLYGVSLLQSDDPLKELGKDVAWAMYNPLDAAYTLSGAKDLKSLGDYGSRRARIGSVKISTKVASMFNLI